MAVTEFVLFLPLMNCNFVLPIIVFLVLLNAITFFSEKGSPQVYFARIIQFLLIAVICGFLWNGRNGSDTFNILSMQTFSYIRYHTILLSGINDTKLERYFIILVGLLILLNEINHFIRYALNLIKVEPAKEEDTTITPTSSSTNTKEVDQKEFKRGKIIGMTERGLIYLFAIGGNFASIGFIVTAKAFARLKKWTIRILPNMC
jgi:hypothetical protein